MVFALGSTPPREESRGRLGTPTSGRHRPPDAGGTAYCRLAGWSGRPGNADLRSAPPAGGGRTTYCRLAGCPAPAPPLLLKYPSQDGPSRCLRFVSPAALPRGCAGPHRENWPEVGVPYTFHSAREGDFKLLRSSGQSVGSTEAFRVPCRRVAGPTGRRSPPSPPLRPPPALIKSRVRLHGQWAGRSRRSARRVGVSRPFSGTGSGTLLTPNSLQVP